MNYLWIALLILLLALLAGLSWQHFRLRHRLKTYTGQLQRIEHFSELGDFAGLEELSGAIHSLMLRFQKQLEQEQIERARLTRLLEQLSDAVILADENGLVTFLNPAAGRMFQTSPARAMGRPVEELLRHHRLIALWERSRTQCETCSEAIEWPVRRLFLNAIVVPDAHHPGGSLILVQDLTRLRLLETMRRDFVANFSHEIRTPLTSIQVLAETLRNGALEEPAAAHRFLEQLEREVQSLTRLAEELLELSQLEAGTLRLEIRPQDVCPWLSQVCARMRLLAEQEGLHLIVECDPQLPPVLADPLRLERVLVNLIQNAIKFSPPGRRVWVTAKPEVGQAQIRFTVRDEGMGIAEEDLPRIFERFYKSRRSQGHGLGLSIARHIVEAHGGRIWVENMPGKGAAFHFVLPVA
jgi:two-component system phosphate regulon sensor histidine kinase PhoR